MGLKVKCKLRAIRYLIDVREEEILVYGLCPVSAESSDTEMMARRIYLSRKLRTDQWWF